ncbi:MAG: glycosyltransferase family 4 protein [Chloroflexia bacterium]
MRVGISAHFWPRLTSGSGQYLRHLVRELARLKGEEELILIGEAGAFADGKPPLPAVELSRGPFPAGRPAKLYFEQVALPCAARSLQLDLLHVPYLAPPLFSPVPTVVTVHDLITRLLPAYRGPWRKRAYTWLDLLAARRARLLIAVSEHTRRDIVRHLRFPAERVWVTYEAASPGMRPASEEEQQALRERYGLPERFILYLGDTDVRKGVHRLLRAFARWRESHPGDAAGLVIAGPLHPPDGRLFLDLPGLARSLGLDGVARFLGPVPEADKAALYSAATVFAFLSEYEGFGLPPLEAMACGTPVLAGNTSSLPEVVGEAGLLVNPLDEEEVVAALGRLLEDASLRAELGRRGRERAAAFSWERTAQETLRVYARAAAGHLAL